MTELLETLKKFAPMANHVAPKRTSIPILKHVIIADGWIMASDLENRVEIPFGCEHSFTMELRMLNALAGGNHSNVILKSIDTREVELDIDGDRNLKYLSSAPGSFPDRPTGHFREIGKWDRNLIKLLASLSPIVSRDELSPSLTGVYFRQEDGQVELCGTNKYKLVRIANISIRSQQPFSGIIRREAIIFLDKFATEGAEVSENYPWMFFKFGNGRVLYSRVIDEKYPDYNSVFDPESAGRFSVDRKSCLKVLRSGAPFASKNTNQIVLSIESDADVARVQSNNPTEQIDWKSTVPLLENQGDGIKIGYNIRYLKSILNLLDGEQADFVYKSPVHATIITGSDPRITALLMPIRLED